MARKNVVGKWDIEPQKSSTAQFITYIASTGASDEKYDIRYEDENIWMSQKMLAAIYGVEVPNIAYHLRKLFADAELDKLSVVKEILITANDDKKYRVNHYNVQAINASTQRGECGPFIDFMLDKILRTLTLKGEIEQIVEVKTSKKTNKKTSKKTSEKLVALLRSMPDATLAELADVTGLSIAGVRWNLNKLKAEHRIQRIGPDKGGHWEVL